VSGVLMLLQLLSLLTLGRRQFVGDRFQLLVFEFASA
jgi:hypothetical protein